MDKLIGLEGRRVQDFKLKHFIALDVQSYYLDGLPLIQIGFNREARTELRAQNEQKHS